jgi:uncharacterized membrane-anchored protein YjiN (DUF445 family)
MWLFTTRNRVDKLVGSVISYLGEAAHHRDHDLRVLIDRLLRVLAIDLQDESPIARQVNVEAMRVLDDPALRAWLVDVLAGARSSLQQTLADPAGPAVTRLTSTVTGYAARVLAEPALHARFHQMLGRLSVHVVDRYADEFTRLVETTVGRWDGKETARRIELLAGRDLQFIRINGSVVGGVAGVAIHAVGIALGSG